MSYVYTWSLSIWSVYIGTNQLSKKSMKRHKPKKVTGQKIMCDGLHDPHSRNSLNVRKWKLSLGVQGAGIKKVEENNIPNLCNSCICPVGKL